MGADSQFAAAIGNAEGVNVPGSLPARNNNPGDLRNWPGVPHDANGYSIFPSMQAGWDALETQLDAIRNGASAYYDASMSIEQMGQIYADGDPSWAMNVAAFLGTTTNAIIGPLLGVSPAPAPSVTSPLSPFLPAAIPAQQQPVSVPPTTLFYLIAAGLGLYLIIDNVFA